MDKVELCRVCEAELEQEEDLFFALCDKCREERHSKMYQSEVFPPNWGEPYKYCYSTSKDYGNASGSMGEVKSKEALLRYFRERIKKWQDYDSSLGREGDKVTDRNLWFWSFTDDITKQEILGNKRIDDFF